MSDDDSSYGNQKLKIYWRQGLFLSPQHLQQQDLFHEGQRQYFWTLRQPFGWGLRHLAIREDGLQNHDFEVLECELVARDGLLVRVSQRANQRNTELHPRNFKQFLDPTGRALSVYIGIPRYQPGQPNLSANPEARGPGTTPTRYCLKTAICPDVFDLESPESEIHFIKYNATLLFDREENFATADRTFELIKIAELLPSSGERPGVCLATNYIPPVLTISSSEVLMERLCGIRDLLTSRAKEFADIRRQRGIRATATSMQEILRLVMLQSLNRYAPVLHHHPRTRQHTPRARLCTLEAVDWRVVRLLRRHRYVGCLSNG